MINSNKTVLVLGDNEGYDTKKFLDKKEILKGRGFNCEYLTFGELLNGKTPLIKTDNIIIPIFFPYAYWNAYIENYAKNGRFYGDTKFGRLFFRLMDKVEEKLAQSYPDKKLSFVNSPEVIKEDRDKIITKEKLIVHGFPTPFSHYPKNSQEVIGILNNGCGSLYAKARFGSLSKGITLLQKDKWTSNFQYQDGSIVSKESDSGWEFKEIKQNPGFLEALIEGGAVFETDIDPPVINDKKFDLRFLFVYGDCICYYARTASAEEITTGADPESSKNPEELSFLDHIPPSRLEEALETARSASKKLGYNYAGVDIMFSKDFSKHYILELNAFPGTTRPEYYGVDPLEVLALKID